MHATNRLYRSLGHERDLGTTLHGFDIVTACHYTYNIHCHDQLRLYNYGKRSDSLSSCYDIRIIVRSRNYINKSSCTYLSKSLGSACVAAKRWINTATVIGFQICSRSRNFIERESQSLSRRLKYSMDTFRLRCDRTQHCKRSASRVTRVRAKRNLEHCYDAD